MSFTTTCGTRTRFKDDDEIKQASESYLESMQQEFYLTGVTELSDKCDIYYLLLLRAIMFNNSIKKFAHGISASYRIAERFLNKLFGCTVDIINN